MNFIIIDGIYCFTLSSDTILHHTQFKNWNSICSLKICCSKLRFATSITYSLVINILSIAQEKDKITLIFASILIFDRYHRQKCHKTNDNSICMEFTIIDCYIENAVQFYEFQFVMVQLGLFNCNTFWSNCNQCHKITNKSTIE